MRPSFIYHQIHAVLEIMASLIGIYLIIKNIQNKNFDKVFTMVAILSISWGIHTIIHYWEEVHYEFNPLKGANKVLDFPSKKFT